MKTSFVLLLFAASAFAADPTADVSVTFTPKEGPAVTAEAPHVSLNAATTLPMDLAFALRIVEISPLQDKEDGPFTRLNIVVRDPGTILPGTPGGGSYPPVQPQPMAIAQALVKLEPDQDIVFLKSAAGTWSVKLSSVSKP